MRELFVGLFFFCIGGQEFVSLGEFNSENEADLSGVNVNSWRSRFIFENRVETGQRRQPKFDVSSLSLKVIIESSCVKFRITVDLLLQLIKADDLFR